MSTIAKTLDETEPTVLSTQKPTQNTNPYEVDRQRAADGRERRRNSWSHANPSAFSSRNFTNRRQLVQFFTAQDSADIRHREKRGLSKRYPYATAPPSTQEPMLGQTVTVDGTEVTVQSQFGPVGVNNPNALVRNATVSPEEAVSYETRRIGPTPLPIYTPPPLPSTSRTPVFRQKDYGGPDWGYQDRTPPPPPTIIYVPVKIYPCSVIMSTILKKLSYLLGNRARDTTSRG